MGVIDRVKEVAGRKKAQFDEGVEKEKRYTAYKHPDADYIVHGQRPYGPKTKAQSEEDDEFATRRAAEKERAAAKREKVRSAVRSGVTRVAGAASGVARSGVRKIGREMKKPATRKKAAGMFEMKGGMLADPLGFNSPRGKGKSMGFAPFSGKPIDPLGFGGKRRQAKFSLF